MKKRLPKQKVKFLGLEKNGVAIINSDNDWKEFLTNEAKVNAKIHLFGHSKISNTQIMKLVNEKEGSTISYDKKKLAFKIFKYYTS